MRKIVLIVSLILCLSPAAARAQGASLGGMAVLAGRDIVFSGFDDDGREGVFLIGADSKVERLCDEQARILAVSDAHVLVAIAQQGEIRLAVLGFDGALAGDLDIEAFDAVAYMDSFFVDRYRIDVIDGKAQSSDLLNGEYRRPIAVYEGFLYYMDGSKYAPVSAMDGLDGISALCRVNLETGEGQRVADEGASLVGFDGDSVIYSMRDFYINENDDVKMVSFARGLYRSDLDGRNARLLADTGSYDDGFYDDYTIVEDGAAYGVRYDYASVDFIPPMNIVRAATDGTALGNVPVDFGTLISVVNNWAYMCTPRYNDEYEYLYDDIMAVDIDTGRAVPLSGPKRMSLNYSEQGVRAMMDEDHRLYFAAIAEGENSPRLWRLDVTNEPVPVARLG